MQKRVNDIMRLRAILRDANKQFDEGYITGEQLKKIALDVYEQYKEIVEKDNDTNLSLFKVILSLLYNPN